MNDRLEVVTVERPAVEIEVIHLSSTSFMKSGRDMRGSTCRPIKTGSPPPASAWTPTTTVGRLDLLGRSLADVPPVDFSTGRCR